MIHLAAVAAVVLATTAQAQEHAPWDSELYDPAGGADLILPMPCGGAMAFQKVLVPVELSDPLDDFGFRMGQSRQDSGYSDYLRSAHLRGAFEDAQAQASYYYLARYEMNAAQYRALTGACDAPFERRDRFAHGRLSWYEAINLGRSYTEWLLSNAPDAVPDTGDRLPYLRLPTEEEWEFAVRGGAVVDPAIFPARRFFTDGTLNDYAHFQSAGQGRSKLRPIGLRKPNPLGLFDVYGNAEELVGGPFQLNAYGRAHGQIGGIVTRGGSVDMEETRIYSAQRQEYPRFSSLDGSALAGTFFGLRLVVSAQVITDAGFDAIRNSWQSAAAEPSSEEVDPLASLAELLNEEVDPRRQSTLAALQHEFRLAQNAAQSSLLRAAKSTMLSGAAFVSDLKDDERAINRLDSAFKELWDLHNRKHNPQERKQFRDAMRANADRQTELRENQQAGLLFYRSTLETLVTDVSPQLREEAYLELGRELDTANQLRLLDDVNAFWGDVNAYLMEPDMDLPTLLHMALD